MKVRMPFFMLRPRSRAGVMQVNRGSDENCFGDR